MKSLLDDLKKEVHVWYCEPQEVQEEDKLAAYRSVLCAQEQERYRKFHFDKDRHSYLVSHALVRHALSQYLDIQASEWTFTRNENGKPILVLPPGMPAISFNLTHTEGLSACIITLDRTCGIDAENTDRKSDHEAVAKRMFAQEELALLGKEDVQWTFFHYWTLREAYLKALGTGLSGSSKDFYFDISADGMSAEIQYRDGQQADDTGWQLRIYEPTPEHVLAVACESDQPVDVRLRELTF